MPLLINKFDTNPKFIINFRDWYDNFITTGGLTSEYLSADYSFDIVSSANDNIIYRGLTNSIKNFHYIQFCEREVSERPCFSNFTTTIITATQVQNNFRFRIT